MAPTVGWAGAAPPEGTVNDELELVRLSDDWDRAMTENDVDLIGAYMADDWTIIGSDGRMTGKEAFLAQVRSGALTHEVMTSEEVLVRVYGDAAVVTARGTSGGHFQGQPFLEIERVTSLFVRAGGAWRCVHTHLSRLGPR